MEKKEQRIPISIVIPVYNVERCLEDCVSSVLRQSFPEFELILVDDGSTDRCGEICDTFSDPRIRVIHKENGGPSDARNVGTAASRGEYIAWVDSDDVIHPDYLKILYGLITDCQADMAVWSLVIQSDSDAVSFPDGFYSVEEYTGMEAMKKMLRGEMMSTSPCGFLIRRSLALRFSFPYGKYHEDDLTTYQFYMNADRVAYTTHPLYCYIQREGSIMHREFSRIDLDELNAADEVYERVEKLGTEYEDAAFVMKASNYCDVFLKFDDLKEKNRDV